MQAILLALFLLKSFPLSFSSPLFPQSEFPSSNLSTRQTTSGPRAARVVIETTFYLDANGNPEVNYDGIRLFHASLEIGPDRGVNTGLRIELLNVETTLGRTYAAVNVLDSGMVPVGWTRGRISRESFARSFVLDQDVTVPNAELIDPQTGRGIIANAWAENPTYSVLENNSHNFVQRLMTRLGLSLPEDLVTAFAAVRQYNIDTQFDYRTRTVPLRYEIERGASFQDNELVGEWNVNDPNNPRDTANFHENEPGSPRLADLNIESPTHRPLGLGLQPPSPPDVARFERPISVFSDPANYPRPENEPAPVAEQDCPLRKRAACRPRSGRVSTDLVLTRTAGRVALIASFARPVVGALGVVGQILAPAFILLDLVEGHFTAAAFGIAGLAAGVLAAFAIAGPLGVFVGALVGTLFAILPGIFSRKTPPPSNNVEQIIQWSFFGDKGHTGNEMCNQNRTAAHLTPNCTAVYGPGVLSKVFGWEIFDAVAFLIRYNGGHSMSIPDIAAAFQVRDYTDTNWGGNVTAVIDCGRTASVSKVKRQMGFSPQPRFQLEHQFSPIGTDSAASLDRRQVAAGPSAFRPPPSNRPPAPPSRGYDCPSPVYSIKRNLINIPVINQTADVIYRQIIPAPGGTCKIISEPLNGYHDELFDVTITGLPAAFICNLTAESYSNSTLAVSINYNNTTPSNGTGSLSISQSMAVIVNLTAAALNSTGFNNTNFNQTGGLGSTTTYYNNSTTSVLTQTSPRVSNLTAEQNSTIYAPSSSGSTNRGYDPAPPPQPFAPLTANNSTCLGVSSSNQILCIPTGTYFPQKNTLGFETRGVSNLSLPANHGISWTETSIGGVGQSQYSQDTRVGYSENITTGSAHSADLTRSMNTLYSTNAPFEIAGNGDPQCACLFTDTSYKGDVICYGPGGGNLTGPILDNAKSVRVWGTSIWIYADHYNDRGGAFISTDVADLSSIAYGTSSSFSGRVKALWVKTPPGFGS